MSVSTFIGSALAAAVILSFIWWLAALSNVNRQRQRPAISTSGSVNTLRQVNPTCTCGHDVTDHGRGELRLVSGCRECECNYWNENRLSMNDQRC